MQFLNVVRDPRAQVASMNRAIIHDFDTILNAETWIEAHRVARMLAERHPERVMTIRGNSAMTIYLLETASDSESEGDLVFANEIETGDDRQRFKGRPKENWTPIQFKWFLNKKKKRDDLIINDFILAIGAGADIVINDKAKKILAPVLGDDVEYLPIDVNGEEPNSWYLFNTLNDLDSVVDFDKSHYMTLSTGKRILTRPVFVEQNIPNNRVFVISKMYNRIYVKGEFLKELVAAHKLTGLQFHPCETIESGPLSKSAAGVK